MTWFYWIQGGVDLLLLFSFLGKDIEPHRRSLEPDDVKLLERVARIEKRLGLKDLPR